MAWIHWSKWYTRAIGILFLLVAVSLVFDSLKFGFRPETMHKIFHVLIGIAVVSIGWGNAQFWRAFPWVNGAFFSFVGLFGFLFPDFGGLDAFNRVDTMLHSIVGITGLAVGIKMVKR